MRHTLSIFALTILFFSTPASAEWVTKYSLTGGALYGCESPPAVDSGIYQKSYYCDLKGVDSRGRESYKFGWTIKVWNGDEPPTEGYFSISSAPIYGMVLSDELCQSIYSSATVLVSDTSDGPYDVGGCTLTPVYSPGVDGFCSYGGSPSPDMCYLTNDFEAVSNGQVSIEGEASHDANTKLPSYLIETSDAASCAGSSMSTGGKSYCVDQSQIDEGNVTYIDFGGANDGGNSGGGGSGGTGNGGSTGGGSTGGGSTGGGGAGGGGASGGGGAGGGGASGGGGGSGGSTGGNNGGDNPTPDPDSGDGLGAVLDAIGTVRNAINSGFNGLVDDIAGVESSVDAVNDSVQDVGSSVDAVNDSVQDVGTSVDDLATTVEEGNQADQDRFDEFMSTDGAPTADGVVSEFDGQGISDDLMADFEGENEGIQDDLTQRYQDLFESDGSIIGRALSGIQDTATSWLPSIPGGGGCVPLTFTFQGHSMVIECRVFDLIKAALSWILFFFTAYQITMMALSYRSGQEA